jgi:hypothetical protein
VDDILSKAEYIAWAQARAQQYVGMADLHNAVASMTSDMQKHSETREHPKLEELAKKGTTLLIEKGDPVAVGHWIQEFSTL